MARRSPHAFTPQDDERVREVYRATTKATLSAGISALCAEMDLPRLSINRRAERLGVTRDIRRPWTARELGYVEIWAGHKTGRVIARELCRSEASVFTKLHELELTRVRKGRRTQTEVCDLFRVTDERVRRWKALGWLRMDDAGTYPDAEVMRFAIAHPEAFDPRTVEVVWLRSLLATLGKRMAELDRFKAREGQRFATDTRRAA